MSDPEHCATVEVLTELVPAAYFSDLDLCSLVVFRIANLAFEHGNSNGSVYAYSLLGFLLRTRFNDHAAGFSFGTLALELAGRRGLDRFRARVYLNFAYCVNPWTRHIKTGRPLLRRGLTAAHETGDLTFAAYLHYCLMTDLLASGDPLDEAQREAEHGLEFAARARFGLVVDILTGHLRLIRALRGLTVALGSFDEAGFDEARFAQHLEGDPGLANPTCVYWIRKLMALYFAGDFPAAVAAAARAEPLLWTSPASFESAEYHFYAGLARAAHHDQAPPAEQAEHRQALAAHHRRVAAWAEPCPANFENRALALAAELARIDGRTLEAMRLYDGAIRSAREHGFVHNEGLAHELAARFHAGLGFETAAGAHLEKARACYARWGATGKVRELERNHPQLGEATPRAQGTAELLPDSLDLATVMKVSQAVSAEIDPARLIDTLMRTALGHAGADRGLLIRPHGDELRVEADAMSVGDRVEVRRRQAPASPAELPESVLRYVVRTRDSLLVDDASAEGRFAADPYVRRHRSRSILCLPLIKQGSLVAILYLENSLAPRVFTPARIAVLKMLASQAAVSLDNARLFAELSHLEAYLAEAQRLSLTGSFGWRISSGEIFWSTQTYEIFELDPAVAPTLPVILARIHRDDVGRVQEFIARTQGPSAEEDWELDYRIMVAGGGVKELHILGHRQRDELGDVEYVGAVMDVTAARQAQRRLHASLEEKDALLKEVHHRVKNNLQLVSSLLNLQASRITDPAVVELFADCRNRVRSMVMVHENLYRAGTFARISMAMHIETLCEHLSTVHGLRRRNIELTTAIDDVDLDLDRAISIGLITNELVSNAVKYAFPEGRPGRIGIALRHLGPRRCALEVHDDGVGLPADLDAATADSLGLQLVHDLADQLHGEMTVSRTGGTAFTVTFDAE